MKVRCILCIEMIDGVSRVIIMFECVEEMEGDSSRWKEGIQNVRSS